MLPAEWVAKSEDAQLPAVSDNLGYSNPDREEVIGMIRFYSALYKVDFSLAYDIARLESNLNPNAKNPHSSAKGIYQFIDSTWKSLCEGEVLAVEDNIKCAIRLLADNKISHWTADPNMKRWLVKLNYVK